MTITKGFLRSRLQLSKATLIQGLLLWVLTAYIFYAFLQLYREAFRLLSGFYGDRILLVLTPTENYVYNLFYAAIASSLGFSIALRFILQNFIKRTNWRILSLTRRTLNSEGFWTWSFLLWFGKLGSILGIWYLVSALQYELDFIAEFPLLLVLLPIVLFYSLWPSLSRLVYSNKLRWFTSLSFIFILMSASFAFKNFKDYKRIDNDILNQSIEHVFNLNRPYSQSHQRIYRKSLILDIYIARDTLRGEKPVIFLENIDNRIDIAAIQSVIAKEMERVPVREQDQLIAIFHIDRHVLMKQINPILDEFRKAGIGQIQYSTGRKYSRYPSNYPALKHSGIQKALLPKYYPAFDNFLDSVVQMDLAGKRFKLLESLMYRNGILRNNNHVVVNVKPDFVTLNKKRIDLLNLEQQVYSFIKKYASNYVIVLNSDDDISYERYIAMLDILWTQIDRLRNEMSYDLYKKPFDYWHLKDEQDTIKQQYPRNILEWSKEEKRLNELIKNADSAQ